MIQWYRDARHGQWVLLMKDSHLETSLGRVELPNGQNLLYLRLHPDGIRFAGVGHQDDLCWEWDGSSWTSHGLAFGPRSVIYDNAGVLHIIRSAPAVGYRYVTNANIIVTAEATYADRERQIWEFTDLPSVTVGQGGDSQYGEDPLIAIYRGKRRVLASGRCRFINAYEEHDGVVISWVQEDRGTAATYTIPLNKLDAFPEWSTLPAPPPTPIPVPPPPIPPMNFLATVEEIRHKYPTPLGSTHASFLLEVARRLNGKLFRKEGGANVLLPNGMHCSMDILILNGQWIDILLDAEGDARVVWDAHDGATGEFIDPFSMEPTIPAAPPLPPPNDSRVALLEAKVRELQEDLHDLAADHTKATVAFNIQLSAFTDALLKLQSRTYVASGTTSRSFSHSHSFSVTVVPRE